MGAVFVWSCVEPFVGIFCACLPTYPPLLRLLWKKFSGLPINTTIKSTLNIKSSTGTTNTTSSRKRGFSTNDDKSAFGGNGVGDKLRGNHGVRRLGSEEELGLTYKITGPVSSPMSPWVVNLPRTPNVNRDEEMGFPMKSINVKKEVEWSSDSGWRGPKGS